jgi:hypothetical protein
MIIQLTINLILDQLHSSTIPQFALSNLLIHDDFPHGNLVLEISSNFCAISLSKHDRTRHRHLLRSRVG